LRPLTPALSPKEDYCFEPVAGGEREEAGPSAETVLFWDLGSKFLNFELSVLGSVLSSQFSVTFLGYEQPGLGS
jgi:hypothetical protein